MYKFYDVNFLENMHVVMVSFLITRVSRTAHSYRLALLGQEIYTTDEIVLPTQKFKRLLKQLKDFLTEEPVW